MTGHLSPETFVDLVDGTQAESAVPHLAICEACRRHLIELRGTWAAAMEADVPEPSPLFWDHLSARVHRAVSAEPAPRAAWWRPGWSWNVAGVVAAVAAAVVLVVLMPARGPEWIGTQPDAGLASPGAAKEQAGVPVAERLREDASIGFVADLAGDLEWDDVVALGISVQGGADRAVADMEEPERVELQRLLNEALAGGV